MTATTGPAVVLEIASGYRKAKVLFAAYELDVFTVLDQAGALKHPFFRERLGLYRQRQALCRKADEAVRDLDFALKQPAAEVPPFTHL